MKTASERVLFRSGEGGYFRYRIPGILAVKDGYLFALEARCKNTGDWGNIDVKVLFSDGETVCEVLRIGDGANVPQDEMYTYNNPVLIPDGEKVHLIYHLNYEKAFIVTSEDGGKTWGEAREITDAYRTANFAWNVCATGPGHGIQMKNGRLVAPVWLAMGEVKGKIRAHQPSAAGLLYSDDGGNTWRVGQLADGIRDASETCVCELADGRLFVNFRNENEIRLRVTAYSKDGGETLEDVRMHPDLPDPICFGGMTADENGNIWFINCASETERENVTVWLSRDMGKTFKKAWHVDDAGGYPDISVKDGVINAFYERIVPGTATWELVWKQAKI